MATATLTYQYARSLAWVDDLSGERSARLRPLRASRGACVPHGWRLEDRRPYYALAPAELLAG